MSVRDSKVYKSLREAIGEAFKLDMNLLIVTIPGTGMSWLAKELTAEGIKWVYDWDWKQEKECLEKLEKLFGELPNDENIVLVVNYPKVLESENRVWSHFYKKFYLGSRDQEDSFLMMDELKPGLSDLEKREIYQKSGGFPQLIKYLVVGGDKDSLQRIVKPMVEAVKGCSKEVLDKLLTGGWGSLVDDYLSEITKRWEIEVGFDLGFSECGHKSKDRLSKAEAEILSKMMTSNGKITKEEVSDIKWGAGKYDEYSDQAINKTIRRLDEKLKKHTITTIPKIGFLLETR